MSEDSTGERPALAYVYQPRSFATLALFGAARDVCRLVWVVREADLDRTDRRLLERTGDVVAIDGLDEAAAAAAVAAHAPSAVLALADDQLATASWLGERLGLPFHSRRVVERLVDKSAQRAALRAAGLRAPGSWLVTGSTPDDELAAALGAAGLPAVLKPRLGEASRDTLRISSLADLLAAVTRERERGGARTFVLESFIPDATGPVAGEGFAGYVSVESVVARGQVRHLAVNGRMPPAEPFRETGFFIPAALDGPLRDDVLAVAARAAEALGIERGCLHTEVKLTPDGPTVIEVNGRIGGGVPELLAATTGFDLLAAAMRVALDLPEFLGELPEPVGIGFLFYVHAPREVGVIAAVDGLDEVRALPGVQEVALRRGPGDAVDWREGNHGHVVTVFGTCATHDELRSLYATVLSTIRITGA